MGTSIRSSRGESEAVAPTHRAPTAADKDAQGTAGNVLRVAVVMNVLPHYRSPFYRRLFRRTDMDVRVFCQASVPGLNLELVHEQFPEHVTIVPSWSMTRDRLGWQRLPWRTLLSSFDVLFVLGNPRVVSNAVLSTWARTAGRAVVIWGQAHTAGGNRLTEGLRLAWWRMFSHVFVYTDGEARRLKARGFRHVVGMNNGLDQGSIDAAAAAWTPSDLTAWRQRESLDGRALILTCARMEPKNRLELWVEALPAVIARRPDVLWCAIGDGAERSRLEAQVHRMGLGTHVRWVGSLVDEGRLAPWFLSSELLVHPAGIGLTLLHAFGYGLPVVTSDDAETHMPEFDAFVPGETGLLYRYGDVASLAATVCRCLEDASARQQMGRRGQQIARDEYNVEVMVERFAAIASHAAGARPRRLAPERTSG
jgi:glycosyltransferase involved in cell wall biosynthesis